MKFRPTAVFAGALNVLPASAAAQAQDESSEVVAATFRERWRDRRRRALDLVKNTAGLAILLAEQYLEVAREWSHRVAIVDHGKWY